MPCHLCYHSTMNTKHRHISVRLPDKLYRSLRILAVRRDTNLSAVLIQAAQAFVMANKRKCISCEHVFEEGTLCPECGGASVEVESE